MYKEAQADPPPTLYPFSWGGGIFNFYEDFPFLVIVGGCILPK
jgi:hypothetical protein